MPMNALSPELSAYDLLRAEILHGDLMPGERLRVADLRARYGVGLTPAREALMQLASEGLVINESNRGARVREISLTEMHDLFATRREIETSCLRLSIANHSPEWEAEILRTLHLLTRAPLPKGADDRETAIHWEARHREFHFALVAACNSDWRLRFWNQLADHSEYYRKLRLLASPGAAIARDIHAEHEALAEAAIAHDADRAVTLMNLHLQRTEKVVADYLSSAPAGHP